MLCIALLVTSVVGLFSMKYAITVRVADRCLRLTLCGWPLATLSVSKGWVQSDGSSEHESPEEHQRHSHLTCTQNNTPASARNVAWLRPVPALPYPTEPGAPTLVKCSRPTSPRTNRCFFVGSGLQVGPITMPQPWAPGFRNQVSGPLLVKYSSQPPRENGESPN